MFLQLAHTKLNVYHSSKALVLECYKLTANFPANEKFAMVQQIRRAAVSVHLNVAVPPKAGRNRKRIGYRN